MIVYDKVVRDRHKANKIRGTKNKRSYKRCYVCQHKILYPARAGAGFKLCCLYCHINLCNAPCETADEDIAMLCLCRCFGLCALFAGKLIGVEGVGRFYGFC